MSHYLAASHSRVCGASACQFNAAVLLACARARIYPCVTDGYASFDLRSPLPCVRMCVCTCPYMHACVREWVSEWVNEWVSECLRASLPRPLSVYNAVFLLVSMRARARATRSTVSVKNLTHVRARACMLRHPIYCHIFQAKYPTVSLTTFCDFNKYKRVSSCFFVCDTLARNDQNTQMFLRLNCFLHWLRWYIV